MSRRQASNTMSSASTSSVTPLACAERISTRRKPYVMTPLAGRAASLIATIERPIAAASVSMCAESESSASDPTTRPTTISKHMKPTISASVNASLRVSASGDTPCECPAWASVAVCVAAFRHCTDGS